MSAITNLEPRIVWEQFDAITRVPRPSKKEGRIIEFLVDFARKHNLEYKKDAIGNVVMRKPATPGFENRPTVILQSHMDMVCEKNSDVSTGTRSARASTAGGSGPKARRSAPTAVSAWPPRWLS